MRHTAKPRILVVSHSASRNGASLLMLNVLRWLAVNADWEIEILVEGPGPLLDEYRAVAKTRVLRNVDVLLALFPASWHDGLRPRLKAWALKIMYFGRRFDLLYANTATTWPHVRALRSQASQVLWHIHELSYVLRLSLSGALAQEQLRQGTRFVAVSDAVADVLAEQYGVAPEAIDTVRGFVPCPALSGADRAARRGAVLDGLGWPSDAFVVGGCGTLGWRKGTDLFLQVARHVRRSGGREVRFLWVGGGTGDRDALEFEHDLRALGLEGVCTRLPTVADPLDYYCTMDAFALTSREDPFPLVMLEAGACGVPTVCFAESGGGPEYVGSDAGLVAPRQDLAAFASHLLTLRDQAELCAALGQQAMAKVHAEFRLQNQAPLLLRAIERALTATGTATAPAPRRAGALPGTTHAS